MNVSTSVTTYRDRRIESLKQHLDRFTVCDDRDRPIGEVCNLKIDGDDRLHLVVRSGSENNGDRYYSILPDRIKDINSENKAISIDTVATDLERTSLDAKNLETIADIDLLEERLTVERSQRKVGEVVVRKVIETETIEVPVRREKLIVERVGNNPQVLAEIDLAEDSSAIQTDDRPQLAATFDSLKTAATLLNAIADADTDSGASVRLELVLEHEKNRATYQKWFDRYGDGDR